MLSSSLRLSSLSPSTATRALHSSRNTPHLIGQASKHLSTVRLPRSNSSNSSYKAYAGTLALAAAISLAMLPVVALDEAHPTSSLAHSHKTVDIEHIQALIQQQGKTVCVVDGRIYDLTDFKERHPGGPEIIEDNNGKDITALFNSLHKRGTLESQLTDDDCIGVLSDASAIDIAQVPGASDEIEERRQALPPVETVLNLTTFEQFAKQVLGEDSRSWRYFSSWSDDGVSFDTTRNVRSFIQCS